MNNIVFGVLTVFVLICLVVLFCIILLKIYIAKAKKYNQLEIEQHKVLNKTIIETQENTLNNIAKELHDDAGQQLTYINFQIENLKIVNPSISNELTPIGKSLSYLAKSIRDLSHSIDNHKFKNYNFINNIKNEFDKINKINILDCSLQIEDNFSFTFSTNENIVLFRIFQEILNNVLKHSKATKFTVEVYQYPTLSIKLYDNGIGFNKTENLLKESTGLNNIKTRANTIDFKSEIRTELYKGTCIVLTRKPIK